MLGWANSQPCAGYSACQLSLIAHSVCLLAPALPWPVHPSQQRTGVSALRSLIQQTHTYPSRVSYILAQSRLRALSLNCCRRHRGYGNGEIYWWPLPGLIEILYMFCWWKQNHNLIKECFHIKYFPMFWQWNVYYLNVSQTLGRALRNVARPNW